MEDRKKRTLTVLDFDKGYLTQDFYRGREHRWLDASQLSGVSGYCDREAQDTLVPLLGGTLPGLCFLGSGNYHYVSHLLLAQITRPFVLVLLDHHTDMQESLFGELLSCGSWVRHSLDTNPFLEEVVLIGASQEAISQVPGEYKKRLYCEPGMEALGAHLRGLTLPIYLSVDKDVFGEEEVCTDWDQGTMSLDGLGEVLRMLERKKPFLGADVCGEIRPGSDREGLWEEKNARNNLANTRILAMLEPFVL